MEIRNIAIIAHVDHGKTTLVDSMLKQSKVFSTHEKIVDRVMDSGDLERERGITISAKPASIVWNNYKINIIDTPGHADFGGEVERILSMVDGVILLVDSSEGPLPQTKFVLSKALKLGLNPIVLINKVDRSDSRPDEVHTEIFDLFDKLGATDTQLDFPTLFSVGRDGWAVRDLEKDERKDLTPLFETIISHIPGPKIDVNKPFTMLATTLESDNYLGRILTGKIETGTVHVGQSVKAIDKDGNLIEQCRVTKIVSFQGVNRIPLDQASSGDIVVIAGFNKATVSDTLCALDISKPIESLPIDPPTLTMTFSVNTSPFAGRCGGTKLTSRMIGDYLIKEAETNIALKVTQSENKESYEVSGRGELQLGILIETMRRNGFELSVSRPRVITKTENDKILEPYEEVVIDVDEEFSGVVVEKMQKRKAELTEMKPSGNGKMRLVFVAPSRGLIGYLSEFRTDTKGTGFMNRIFHSYMEYKGNIDSYRNGVLVSMEQGKSNAYALFNLQPRGTLFIEPGIDVYSGMIIGENSLATDLEVNPVKGKQLTNIRAAGSDEKILLTPPRKITLEEALSYIKDDEIVEVTPKVIRIRKKELNYNIRKKMLGRDK